MLDPAALGLPKGATSEEIVAAAIAQTAKKHTPLCAAQKKAAAECAGKIKPVKPD
jgi:hypothetical protein